MNKFSNLLKKFQGNYAELKDSCAPEIKSNKINNSKLNVAFLYMFKQIKDSNLDDVLIHMDDTLQEWWKEYWEQYERNIVAEELTEKLSQLIIKNFNDDELEVMGNLDEFKLGLGKSKMSEDAKRS